MVGRKIERCEKPRISVPAPLRAVEVENHGRVTWDLVLGA